MLPSDTTMPVPRVVVSQTKSLDVVELDPVFPVLEDRLFWGGFPLTFKY